MEIESVLEQGSDRIKEARSELHALLLDNGRIEGFGPGYAAALFANTAANLRAVELLIGDGFTSSAAVLLRTVIFGAIRLAWLADADSIDELEARVVAFQASSLDYEAGLFHKARRSGGDPDKIEELLGQVEEAKREIQQWKSEAEAGRRLVDEIAIAENLNDMGGLITVVAMLDQFVHVNSPAINSALSPDPNAEGALVIGDRPQPAFVPPMVTAAMQALAIASESFLRLIEADPNTIEQVRLAGQQWVKSAINDAESEES